MLLEGIKEHEDRFSVEQRKEGAELVTHGIFSTTYLF